MTTREQAIDQGLLRYDMDKPCKHGHLAERYTKSRVCCSCNLEHQERRRKADPEANRTHVKRWQKANPDKHNAKGRKWYSNNREQHDVAVRDWQRRNPEKVRAIGAAYRAKKLMATPPWADIDALERFYLECPKGYEVDHVVPLKHPLICGLHVAGNLQYLTPFENRSKSNSWP